MNINKITEVIHGNYVHECRLMPFNIPQKYSGKSKFDRMISKPPMSHEAFFSASKKSCSHLALTSRIDFQFSPLTENCKVSVLMLTEF